MRPLLLSAALLVTFCSGCGGGVAEVATSPSSAPASESKAADRPAGQPSAEQVVAALKKARLGISEVRDNTAKNCGSLGCVQLITTRTVSVYEWPTVRAAKTFAAKWGKPRKQVGRFVLSWFGRNDQDMPSAKVRKAQAIEVYRFLNG